MELHSRQVPPLAKQPREDVGLKLPASRPLDHTPQPQLLPVPEELRARARLRESTERDVDKLRPLEDERGKHAKSLQLPPRLLNRPPVSYRQLRLPQPKPPVTPLEPTLPEPPRCL